MMFDHVRLFGSRDKLARESTIRYVFGLVWPSACIDCSAVDDCFLVGVCEGELRHVIRVPCALVEFDEGLTLVRALYRSGFPKELSAAPSARSLSL
jgi:hypothetical protein